jgi:hypothetical protein
MLTNLLFSHQRGGGHNSCVQILEAYAGVKPAAAPAAVAPGSFPGKIATSELAGLWCCLCFPFGAAIFCKTASGDDELIHR